MPADERRLPQPTAVLFDLDGTLVDTVPTRIEAWALTFAHFGLAADRAQLGPLIGADGKRLAREVGATVGVSIDDERAEEIDRFSGEVYGRLNREPRPLPGVADLVEVLERRGIAWAIATSSRREQVATSVHALGLGHEPTIVDGSHVKNAKPEPDLLLLGAERLSVDPAHCWYVGDSSWDIVAAVAAGMVAIGVTAGAAVDGEVLAGAGATAVVPTLADLVRALDVARE